MVRSPSFPASILAAALAATLALAAPAAAIGPVDFAVTHTGFSEEVFGVTVGGSADVDVEHPMSSGGDVCLAFDPSSQRGFDIDGNVLVVYLTFLGPTSTQPEGQQDAHAPQVRVGDVSTPRDLPIMDPPSDLGLGWGTWEAGYSQSDC